MLSLWRKETRFLQETGFLDSGPVLNRAGEVVAVNGMHAYPLWGDPYVFKDGSQPAQNLKQQMVRYSWSIPIQTFVRLSLSPAYSLSHISEGLRNPVSLRNRVSGP